MVFNFGLRQLKNDPPASRTLKVTFVQPSIPQTVIWDETKGTERFGDLLRLSEQALTNDGMLGGASCHLTYTNR